MNNIYVERGVHLDVKRGECLDVERGERLNVERCERLDVERRESLGVERREGLEVERRERLDVERRERLDVESAERLDAESAERLDFERAERLDFERAERLDFAGVREHETTYIAKCFRSVESELVDSRALQRSVHELQTDPGDPHWDYIWHDITRSLAKFKFLQDQANSLLSDFGYSAPNSSSGIFTARDYGSVIYYCRRNNLQWKHGICHFEAFRRLYVLPMK